MCSHALLNHVGIRLVAALTAFSAWYHLALVALLVVALAAAGLRVLILEKNPRIGGRCSGTW